MTDDKPMSADEKARKALGFPRPCTCFAHSHGTTTRHRGCHGLCEDAVDAIATALRDHAAEAVEAERERCAGRFHKDQVEVWTSEIVEHLINFNDPQDYEEVLQLHKGVEDELYKIRDIVSARSEGGEGDG